MLLYILLGLIGVLVLGMIGATVDGRRLSKRLAMRLAEMDQKYVEFVEKRIAQHVLERGDLGIEAPKMVDEILVFLKPEIHGLIQQLNATYLSSVHIAHHSPYFPSILSWCESAMAKKRVQGKRIYPEDEKELLGFLHDAVAADVQQRLLLLKIG